MKHIQDILDLEECINHIKDKVKQLEIVQQYSEYQYEDYKWQVREAQR